MRLTTPATYLRGARVRWRAIETGQRTEDVARCQRLCFANQLLPQIGVAVCVTATLDRHRNDDSRVHPLACKTEFEIRVRVGIGWWRDWRGQKCVLGRY